MIENSYFIDFPYLESERLIYRKFEMSDASEIYFIRTNDEVMKYMDSPKHQTLEESERFIAKNLETYNNKEGIFWAIIEKVTNEFVGDFAYYKIIQDHFRAEIGYTLKPQFWGKGYMREAMNTLIRFGFHDLNLHSIEANINPENLSSRNALLKMGFKQEAYFRENLFFNGKFLDSEVYCLLSTDFNRS